MLDKAQLNHMTKPVLPDFGPDPANEEVSLFNLVEDRQMFNKMILER